MTLSVPLTLAPVHPAPASLLPARLPSRTAFQTSPAARPVDAENILFPLNPSPTAFSRTAEGPLPGTCLPRPLLTPSWPLGRPLPEAGCPTSATWVHAQRATVPPWCQNVPGAWQLRRVLSEAMAVSHGVQKCPAEPSASLSSVRSPRWTPHRPARLGTTPTLLLHQPARELSQRSLTATLTRVAGAGSRPSWVSIAEGTAWSALQASSWGQ